MTRTKVPYRRPNATFKLEHRGIRFHVTIGFDLETGEPVEVFGSSSKSGSDFAAVLNDACVSISLALQHGVPPALLSKSLGREPAPFGAKTELEPASVIGCIAEALTRETATQQRAIE